MTRGKRINNYARIRRVDTKKFYYFSFSICLLKLFWLLSQPGRGFLGADGENYLEALDGLLLDGIFSQNPKLSYWPAGYPILMWPLTVFGVDNLVFLVGTIQSILFAFATYYFAKEIHQSTLRKFAWPSLVILNISPTLTLNSVAIGYEVTSASFLLLALSMYLRLIRLNVKSVANIENLIASTALMLATFMQPRIILLAIGLIVPFALFQYRGKLIGCFLVLSLIVISVAPATLIFRNIYANGYAAISTNLGATMNVGAGPLASGGYSNSAQGVPCTNTDGNAAQQDRHRIGCVIDWYLSNPAQAVKLSVSKFFFHWSPWFGPQANGTMARNPWLRFSPLVEFANTEDGDKIVFGGVGKTVSSIWVFLSLGLQAIGFQILRRNGGISTLIAWALVVPIILNTLTSMATIGDHRFRIPTLTFSILLQMFGIYYLFSRNLFQRNEGKKHLRK